MAIDATSIVNGLKELRTLVAAKLETEPLPVGAAAARCLQADIERLGLKAHIADLETKGYAVLGPGEAKPVEFFDRLRDTLLRLAETDASVDAGAASGLGKTLYHLLPKDPIFEEALMAPKPLALVTYLLGHRAKLSQSTGLIKASDAAALPLHADHSSKLPAPWPRVAQYCNVTWVTTDYTRENGAVCVWPGSHRLSRPVPPELIRAHDHEEVEVLELPRGSVIVWHGSLWHGAVPRTAAGKRVTLVLPHVRDHIQSQELYWATTTPAMIARNPTRFGTLMGLTSQYPWIQEGPSFLPNGVPALTGSQFE